GLRGGPGRRRRDCAAVARTRSVARRRFWRAMTPAHSCLQQAQRFQLAGAMTAAVEVRRDGEHGARLAFTVGIALDEREHLEARGFYRCHGNGNDRTGARIPAASSLRGMQLADSTAIVTGGASGMGEATARRLSAAGATVVVLDRDAAKGEKVASDLGGRFVQADVTDPDDVSAAVAAAAALAPLRACIHCAGIGWAERTINREGAPHSLDTFRTVIEINLIGTFNVLRLAASAMSANT